MDRSSPVGQICTVDLSCELLRRRLRELLCHLLLFWHVWLLYEAAVLWT